MKYIKSLYVGLALMAGFGFTSCQSDMDDPGVQTPVATMQANTTIAELKAAMWQNDDNYATLCPQREDGSDYIIKGRIVSSDASGNIYKKLYIQDETGAITLSINQNSLYNEYRFGQEIVMDVTGLYVGKYAALEQIGGYGEYNGTPQVTFMAFPNFCSHVELNGDPVTDVKYINYGDAAPTDGSPYCIVTKISDLSTTTEGLQKMQSQLVEFRDVHFEKGGADTFASYQSTESRNLVDEAGNTIVVRTSGYSNFYSRTLPEGVGTVRAMLSYYNGTWQLELRSYSDVLFDSVGTKDEPYSVTDAIDPLNAGSTGWVKGYIVGSVKAGVSEVTSNDQIIWGDAAEMDQTLVIGVSADTKNYQEAFVVLLPQGTPLRQYGNLLDNPSNIGKEILIRGTFGTLLGMNGLTGNTGSADEFEISGVSTGGTSNSKMDGSAEYPYDVNYVMNSTADEEGVWIEGWYVGSVSGKTWSDGATFSATPGSEYTNTNFILGQTADSNSTSTSIPVALPSAVRNDLGLGNNPSIYGKHIRIKGNIIKYFGVRAVKEVTEYVIIDGSDSGSDSDSGSTTVNPGSGAGTIASPYDVSYVKNSTADEEGVWVEGWYVGSVSGKTWSTGATFSATPGDEYTNTNFILGQTANANSIDSSIPVALPSAIRNDLGLGNNPSIYGKHIRIKGNIIKYFGVRAVKEVTEYEVID